MSRTRDLDRRSDVKPLCVVSVPYVRGVSEKFESERFFEEVHKIEAFVFNNICNIMIH